MPLLAQDAADKQAWRNIRGDERKALLQELEDDTAAKGHTGPLVTPIKIASHYETELDALVSEVSAGFFPDEALKLIIYQLIGLGRRTGFHHLLFTMKKETMDVIGPRSIYTPETAEAVAHLFKVTPNEMNIKLQSYLTTGMAGVIRDTKTKRLTALKGEIRELVLSKLRE